MENVPYLRDVNEKYYEPCLVAPAFFFHPCYIIPLLQNEHPFSIRNKFISFLSHAVSFPFVYLVIIQKKKQNEKNNLIEQ